MRISCLFLSAVMVLSIIAGCGRSDRVPLGKVQGTVSYLGKPVASGALYIEVSGARPASGKIVDGKIVEVTTYEPDDGAPVGMANISITATEPVDPSKPPPPPQTEPGQAAFREIRKPVIPKKYGAFSDSGLTHKIEAGMNTIVLDLK